MRSVDRGRTAEELACRYLLQRGLVLLDRNYHCRRGEIDLILRDTDTLVFVEVRYRRQGRFGSAAESVDWHKQKRLTACARHYLQARLPAARKDCRFDVVAIDGPDQTIAWIRNAFAVIE
ncbi:MAG: YraN family protein [Gammaproteobacteria bacterium]